MAQAASVLELGRLSGPALQPQVEVLAVRAMAVAASGSSWPSSAAQPPALRPCSRRLRQGRPSGPGRVQHPRKCTRTSPWSGKRWCCTAESRLSAPTVSPTHSPEALRNNRRRAVTRKHSQAQPRVFFWLPWSLTSASKVRR